MFALDDPRLDSKNAFKSQKAQKLCSKNTALKEKFA